MGGRIRWLGLCGAFLCASFVSASARAYAPATNPPPGISRTTETLEQVLSRSDAATGPGVPGPTVEDWTIAAYGLSGRVHVVSDGDDYRESTTLGPFTYGEGRRGGQGWRQTANGFTLLLHGAPDADEVSTTMLRQALRARRRVRLLGQVSTPVPAYVVEYRTSSGAPEWLYFDAASGLLTRLELALSDRRVSVALDDFRNTNGSVRAWHLHARDLFSRQNDVDWRLEKLQQGASGAARDLEIPKTGRAIAVFPYGSSHVVVPARFVGPYIIVPVTIEGRTLDFLLDTGTSDIVIDRSIAHELGLHEYGHSIGTAAHRVAESQLFVPEMRVGRLRFKRFAAFSLPFSYRPRPDVHVVGILGFDLFSSGVVHVDYYHQRVELFSPSAFRGAPVRGETRMPIALDDAVPVTLARVGASYARVVVDTGAPYLIFFPAFTRSHPSDFPNSGVSEALHAKLPSLSAGGVGGSFRLVPVQLRSFAFGPESFNLFVVERAENAPAFENLDADGLLGWQFLHFFDIYFDYRAGAMYVKPNPWMRDLANLSP